MPRRYAAPALLALALPVAGCPGMLTDPDSFRAARDAARDAPASSDGGCALPIDVERDLFLPRCATANCHNAAMRAQMLDLESPGVASRVVGVRATSPMCTTRILANPDDPNGSFLVQKLRRGPACGFQMPLGGARFNEDEIACVAAWIVAQRGRDGGVDDAGRDATTDGMADAAMDAPPDVRPDAPADVPADVRPDAPPPMMVFYEQAGTVTVEAENADALSPLGGFQWTRSTARAGFAGTGALVATPNSGVVRDTPGYAANSPRARFWVDFQTTGTYYVWARGWGAANNQSVHVGVNNTETASADRLSGFAIAGMPDAWRWSSTTLDASARATITVATRGVRAIDVWMREDGTEIDKLVLTTNAAMTPSANGPAQSPRGLPR